MNAKLIILILACIAAGGAFHYWQHQAEQKLMAEQKSEFEARDKKLAQLDSLQQSLVDQMKAAVGKGACESDVECRVAPLGVKVCDGYKDFIVYSLKDSNFEVLQRLIKRFNDNENSVHDLLIQTRSCGKPTPTATCIGGRCTVAAN